MEGSGNLISVRSDVAAALLIDGLFEEAAGRLADPQLPGALDGAENPRAARLGYLARTIEVERFAPAREPYPWLAEELERDQAEAVAARLAAEEPAGKPAPGDGAASWRVPGPGGHVRHFLAVRAGHKRAWMLGFFTRCCDEARGPTG